MKMVMANLTIEIEHGPVKARPEEWQQAVQTALDEVMVFFDEILVDELNTTADIESNCTFSEVNVGDIRLKVQE